MAIWGVGVMVGPILGPTLGGYLTDVYDWRWVFYVNLPFGIAAVTGISLFLRDTDRHEGLKFDWFGFAVLGIGLGALQLMLDRGTTKDSLSTCSPPANPSCRSTFSRIAILPPLSY
jgi:DHA2 family multidrug resistance protein